MTYCVLYLFEVVVLLSAGACPPKPISALHLTKQRVELLLYVIEAVILMGLSRVEHLCHAGFSLIDVHRRVNGLYS